MADQSVMTTPIFDELLSEFGSDLTTGDAVPAPDGDREREQD